MFVALWEFEVKPGDQERFEGAYGHHGQWAKLFRHGKGYEGTRLLLRRGAAVRARAAGRHEKRRARPEGGRSGRRNVRGSPADWSTASAAR